MARADNDRLHQMDKSETVLMVDKGAKLEKLETLGGDISYSKVKVISGRMPDRQSLAGTEKWIATKKLTQAALPTDELKSVFDKLASRFDGMAMEAPSFNDKEFFGAISNGIDYDGKIDQTDHIDSFELRCLANITAKSQ